MANEKIVKQWFDYAARDLKLAKSALNFSLLFKREAAFHAQQCLEKAIKGYLVSRGLRPPKTHDIRVLADAVNTIDTGLGKKLMKGERLTDYAVTYRYPDAAQTPVTVAQSRAAIKVAEDLHKLLFGISKKR